MLVSPPLFPCIVSDKPTLFLSICYLSVVYVVLEDMKRHRDAMTKLLHLRSLPCMDLTEFRNVWVASENPQLGEKHHVWWVRASNEAEEANWKALPTYLNVPMELAMSCYFRERGEVGYQDCSSHCPRARADNCAATAPQTVA